MTQAEMAMQVRQAPHRQVEAQAEIDGADGEDLPEHAKPAQTHDGQQPQAAVRPKTDLGLISEFEVAHGGGEIVVLLLC